MSNHAFVQEVLRRNRYLTLATSDGETPWIAPLEYIRDESDDLYFVSPESSLHVQHIEKNPRVAVAIFDSEQAEYTGQSSFRLGGLQMSGRARRVPIDECPQAVRVVLDKWSPPMPPYILYVIEQKTCFVPVIEDGVNARIEISTEDDASS